MLIFPSLEPQRITDPDDAANLADHVCNANRTRPVLVLTCIKDHDDPDIAVESLAAMTHGCIDIVIVPDAFTSPLSDRFSALRRDDLNVYHGAARIYPVGIAQRSEPSQSAILYTDTAPHRRKLFDALREIVEHSPGCPSFQPVEQSPGRFIGQPVQHKGKTIMDDLRTKYDHPIIRTGRQARNLVSFLLSAKRRLPAVVVSHVSGRLPCVDIDLATGLLHGNAHVIEIISEDGTRVLEEMLTRPMAVYGEAGRVYPTGTDWSRRPGTLRTFLPNAHVSRMLLTNLIISEALYQRASSLRLAGPSEADEEATLGRMLRSE